MSLDQHNTASVLCHNRWKYEQFRHANGSPAIPRAEARSLAIDRGLITPNQSVDTVDTKPTFFDLPIQRDPYAAELLSKPSHMLVPADGMTWLEITSHGRCLPLFSNTMDDLRTNMDEWDAAQLLCHKRFKFEAFRRQNGLPSIPHIAARTLALKRGFVSSVNPPPEKPIIMVDGFPTNDDRIDIPNEASRPTGPVQPRGTINSTSTTSPSTMDDGHHVTVIDSVVTPIPISSAPDNDADGKASGSTGSGNASRYRHYASNIPRRGDVGPINSITCRRRRSAARTPIQLRSIFPSSKEHLQYLGILRQLELTKSELNRYHEEPDFVKQLDAFILGVIVMATSIGQTMRRILKAALKEILWMTIAFVGMSALWLVPNIGAELGVLFLIWWSSTSTK